MTASPRRTRVRTGAHWGMYEAEVEDGRLVAAAPFAGDPDPSPIVAAMPSAVHAECRVERPMVRKGWLDRGVDGGGAGRGVEPFVPVTWDQALDLVAGELRRVKTRYGNEAIYACSGWASAGAFHQAHAQLHRFLNCFGGAIGSVTNWSFGAASVIVPRVVGTMEPVVGRITSWPTIAAHSDMMVLFGGIAPKNAQVNMYGIGRHETAGWLRRVAEAGVELVSISPIRDDAAACPGAEWLPIRPNADTALMLGLMHTLVAEELHDRAFLDRYCVSFDRFRRYLMGETDGAPKSAEWAAGLAEIDAGAIRALARRMAGARCLIAASWSVQRADHGEQPYWALIALAALLGQIGLPGGGFGFGYGATGTLGGPRPKLPAPALPTGRNPVAAYIPVARLTDMLLAPGASFDFNGERLTYPHARLIYWCGGNPFHKQQDLNQLAAAWRRPETVIVHEPWWTPAARRADVVLPCATTVERNDVGGSPFDRFWFAMRKAIEPVGESRTEYDIYTALAERLGFADAFTEGRSEMDWLRHLYDVARQAAAAQRFETPGFDEFWRAGHFEFPPPEDPPVLFSEFRADPEGNPLKTPSGRIELFSETIDGFGYDDCPGHPVWLEPGEWLGADRAAVYPLHLISNQPRWRLHSQLDCGEVSRAAKVAGREPIRINRADAAARGIADGDLVRVYNDRGACLAGACVTDDVRPGVAQLATGAWYDPHDPAEVGSIDLHGNPNVLTRNKGTSRLAQSCSAQSTLVEVERCGAEAPPVAAFDPPAFVEAPSVDPRGLDPRDADRQTQDL